MSGVFLFGINLLLLRMSVIESQLMSLREDVSLRSVDRVLVEMLRHSLIDFDISSVLGNRGLDTSIRKPFYEPADAKTNTYMALLRLIFSPSYNDDVEAELTRISVLYLLQFKLGLDENIFFAKSLMQLVNSLKDRTYFGVRVVEVRIPVVGDSINLDWMSPRSDPAGFRVKTTLGVAIFDENKKVIVKAPVLGK
ncbi:MAG: hypothetical protein LBQ66_14450 [Planctomycetaceae bacterium]|jgi:hypothetical protein|nr:hypothetical protein [Planctomycetaceae bacterium]